MALNIQGTLRSYFTVVHLTGKVQFRSQRIQHILNLKLAVHIQEKSGGYSGVEHLSSKVHLANQLTTDELFKILTSYTISTIYQHQCNSTHTNDEQPTKK